jgi:7,8-dihydropterin-6-yl-methyl-4-(beta-D-ribofuranosyl)aminobenzene 5'-phosphate synthase
MLKFSGIVLLLSIVFCLATYASAEEDRMIEITILYNNVPHDTLLETDWGFACLVKGAEKPILFDTGGNGRILLENMKKKGIEPESIRVLVLSHIHGDHTDGVWQLLKTNRKMSLIVPASFPQDFVARAETLCAGITKVDSALTIMPDVWTTGEMGSQTREQGLILSSQEGGILVTGCAHPGIAEMASRARDVLGSELYLVLGGFHLRSADRKRVTKIIEELKELGVRCVAPSHCTGEEQIRFFAETFGDGFIPGGCGAVIRVPNGDKATE